MIDFAISQKQLTDWANDLQLVANITQSHAVILTANVAGEYRQLIQSERCQLVDIEALVRHFNHKAHLNLYQHATPKVNTPSTRSASHYPFNESSTFSHHQVNIPLDVRHAAAFKQALIPDVKSTPKWRDTGLGSLIYLPIIWNSGAHFGVFCLYHHTPLQLDDKALQLASLTVNSLQLNLSELHRAQRLQMAALRGDAKSMDVIDLQTFIDSFEEHIWVKNTDGVYTICNQSVENAWELPRSDIIGKTDEELFGKAIADIFLNGDKLAIDTGAPIIVAECLDGENQNKHLWLETLKIPALTPEGELAGVIGMTRNISKHKEVEEQLTLATNVFKHSLEGVVVTDRHGNITDVNGAFYEITGYSREELLGQNPRLFNSGRHDKAFFETMWNHLLDAGKWNGEIWNRRKDGTIFPQNITISAIYDEVGEIRYFVAVFADISAQKQSEAQLAHLAYFDPLTHLPNRMKLMMQLKQEVRHSKRLNAQLATVFIDVDLFKHINDSFGHSIGDEMLVELAKRLRSQLQEQDVLSRIGGDEFVALISGIQGHEDATAAINQLRQVFDLPFVVSTGDHLRLTASMGISLYPSDGSNADTLLRNADAAMYRAKSEGRNNYAFYTESLTKESIEHLKLQSALYGALEQNSLYLMYQPKLNLVTRKTVGVEALLRWNDPILGQISPGMFIPVAEKIGLIYDIGLWVLETACQQGVRWLADGKQFGRIAVNVAGQQLQRGSFVEDVKRILTQTGLPATCLELEVTESVMMNNPDVAIRDLKLLGDLGIELSVDDFGTGYSSLNYLKKLPIHKLKIDQSFVRDIPFDTNNTAIAKAVIALGHALKLDIVAEGVETIEQAEFLTQNFCDQAQGYLFSRPQLPADVEAFFTEAELFTKPK
ncbi:EAL domain-containing protein [Shewanella xiamenensis]|uniref:EAL domain-containing protein n=1 Tax=Shewanella xiamenensis TaxID=332186 RepID=UPI00313E03BF